MTVPALAVVAVGMIDTLAIARAVTAADLTPARADAITDAVGG